jgi:hypothetical protein
MPFQFTNEATLAQVVGTAMRLVSLTPPPNIATSTDTAVQLMVTAANTANLELLNSYEWPELTRTGEITVSNPTPPNPGQAVELSYDLPEDFFRFIDQTQWNASMRFPAVGPVSPQGWMTYLVFPISANFTLTWQVRDGKIWFLNPPAPPGQVFRFMYLSRAIVQDADDATLYKNVANKDGDKFVLDGTLLTLLTRVKWLEAKGFDSSAAARDYASMWDTRVGAKKGANILNMAGQRGGYPYIGIGNLPDASLYGMRQW